MRLICPNCGAHYEVPDDVIPKAGRDVQCSNCDHTWFFRPTAPEPAEAPPIDTPDGAAAENGETPPPGLEEALPRPRREIDPDVLDVLREEAAYEARARAAESTTLETQPELGLGPGDSPEGIARRRMAAARTRTNATEAEENTAPADRALEPETTQSTPAEQTITSRTAGSTGSRRDLLPDVDDINATLTAEPDRRADGSAAGSLADPSDGRSRRGWGFLLALTFAGLALALYLYAAQMQGSDTALPQPLQDYVAAVDAGRAWLDARVLDALAWWDGASGAGADTAGPADG